MKQSLDDAFCKHVIEKEIITKENIDNVKVKYTDVCIREALLLEGKLQFEYYVATLSILKEQAFEKSNVSQYWDQKFLSYIEETAFLENSAVKSFHSKSKNAGISFRELLLVSGILSFEKYSSIFQELLKKNTPNSSSDFDTSEIEFLEKKLDTLESNLKKSSKQDDSDKTLDFAVDPKAQIEDSLQSILDGSTSKDSVNSSVVTIDIPADKTRDLSVETLDTVTAPIAIFPRKNDADFDDDASAMTLDVVMSPEESKGEAFIKQNDGSFIESDASAMTIDAVESPLKIEELVVSGDENESDLSPSANGNYFENDASEMTVDAVESPVNSSYFSSLQNEELDTAKTITSDISFSEYMESLSAEKEENIKSPNTNETFNTTELNSDVLNSYFSSDDPESSEDKAMPQQSEETDVPDASLETLLESKIDNIEIVEDAETDRVKTVQEKTEDAEATLDMSSRDLDNYFEKDNEKELAIEPLDKKVVDASARTVQDDPHYNPNLESYAADKPMHDAFPSAIVEKIGGLDEKTTNLTNLIREMRESQVLQVPLSGFSQGKNYVFIFLFFLCLSAISAVFYFLWMNRGIFSSSVVESRSLSFSNRIEKQGVSPVALFYFKEEQYREALNAVDKNASPLFLAKCYVGDKQYLKAIGILKKIAGLKPNNARYQYDLAKAYQKAEEEPALILETYDNALQLGYPKVFVQLEKLQLFIEKELATPQEIEALIKEIEEQIPDSARLINLKSLHYLSQKMWEKARDSLSKAVAISASAKIYLKRGRVYYEMAMFEKAILDLKESIALNGKIAESHFFLGQTYTALKKMNALASYNKAIELAPHNVLFQQKKVELLLLAKKYKNALDTVLSAIKLFHYSPILYAYKAVIFLKMKKNKEAELSLQRALDLGKNNPEVLLVQSRYYWIKRDYPQAIALARKSIKLAPKTNWQGYKFLGDLYAKTKQKEKAEQSWKEALTIYPYIPDLKKKSP